MNRLSIGIFGVISLFTRATVAIAACLLLSSSPAMAQADHSNGVGKEGNRAQSGKGSGPTEPIVLESGMFVVAEGGSKEWTAAGIAASAINLSGSIRQAKFTRFEEVGVPGANFSATPNQINFDPNTGESEFLIFTFDLPAYDVAFTFTQLGAAEVGGEQGMWQAFDEEGRLLAEGFIGPENVQYGGHVGTVLIEGVRGIKKLVFSALPYVDTEQAAGITWDSSDYYIKRIEYIVD